MASGGGGQRSSWLIAAWPGMGNVAVLAAGYLVQKLGLSPAGELDAPEHFDINEISVKEGRVEPVRLPRGMLFRLEPPGGERRLLVFLGESQPSFGVYAYARRLVARAIDLGADRVVTFASMASNIHPKANPKVVGIGTDDRALADLKRAEVPLMEGGQIGGLNGLLLAAAAERGLTGLSLLAEIPFFAANVPNPKAASAALSVFSVLSGFEISLAELNEHADTVDEMLTKAYDQLKEQGAFGEEEPEQAEGEETDQGEPRPEAERPRPPALDAAARQRLERLFDEAKSDQSKAVPLKQELDRLGVFKEYENRFLDLFRRAG